MNASVELFSVAGLILGITSVILVLILSIYGKKQFHKIWTLFNVAVAWWGIGAFFIGKTTDVGQALFIWKIVNIGIIFIPVFFYHFSCVFSSINRKYLIL